MKVWRRTLALVLIVSGTVNLAPLVKACGPEVIEPVFVFANSPDLPFESFTQGKIGIVKNTFGRKTLVIAYRYLSGGAFTEEEQRALVEALKGKQPEHNNEQAIKGWIAARNEVATAEEGSPEIYDERRQGSYDFFPNCAKNAFEVATQTLKARVGSYGTDSPFVHDWLIAQDVVFQNCAEGSNAPHEVGSESPMWLRKDRDYQIAAAFFYSLNLDAARARFEQIAQDAESPWQRTAEYLVGRTLVRQASLSNDEITKRELYEKAERYLMIQLWRSDKFSNATRRLLGLVKYRLRPEERIRELARELVTQSGNDNLGQDLIDYTWLLDKFDAQAQSAEVERKARLEPQTQPQNSPPQLANQRDIETDKAIQRGDLIEFWFGPRKPDGEPDYAKSQRWVFNHDASEVEILLAVEGGMGRKLTPAESKDLKEKYSEALSTRLWNISPNRKLNPDGDYQGCGYYCNQLKLDLLPQFLREDELSDWILTFQSNDLESYSHAWSRWKETQSPAWLVAALTKADKTTTGVERLLRQAERIQADSPAFPTAAYHRIRLELALGKEAEARKLLNDIVSARFEELPISSQNQFLEQRMNLSETLSEFLTFARRKPVAFYEDGSYGTIKDLLGIEKSFEEPGNDEEPLELQRKESFKDLLAWDERVTFDERTAEILNWHLPLLSLFEASQDVALPDYLKRELVLSVWTRSILLRNETVARKVAPDVARLVPEMLDALSSYLNAKTNAEREAEALYILLKFPNLTPYIPSGIPEFNTSEKVDYYFESTWWCAQSQTSYDNDGNEVRKVVASPPFLSTELLAAAQHERSALVALGDANTFLGKRVLEWAKSSPDDPRIPEALFIALKANEGYKYGCGGWESDMVLKQAAERILRKRYPASPWTAKLSEGDN
jgi:hypothetical protein